MLLSTPARSAVVAAALLCALAAPASGDIFSDVGAIPSPFSPNADGVFDSTAVYYTLSEQAAVVVTIADWQGEPFWTEWSGWEDPGTHSHWWDGWYRDTLYNPVLVPDGDYIFLLKAIVDGRTIDEADFPFTVDTEAPPLDHFAVAPSRFSPDGDGVGDSLLVSYSAHVGDPSDQVLVTAYDSQDEAVRLVYSAVGVPSADVFWDGMDDEGALVEDGLYYVKAETRDAAGNSSEMGALVDLDTSPPTLGVDYPDTNETVVRVDTPVAEVTGWAYDRAGVVSVEYSLDGEEWLEATVGRPDSVTWAASIACTDCVPDTLDSEVTVYVRAHDGTPTATGEGHVNSADASVPELEFDLVFDVAPPAHESSTVNSGGTFTRGETITLTSKWDASGYDVAADFSEVDSEYDPDDVQVSETTGNRYTITYTISNFNTLVPVTNAPIPVTATDAFERSVSDTTVTVDVLPGSSDGPAGFAVSANSFKPLEGGYVSVTLGSTARSTIDIYNMAGTLVRTLEGEGASTLRWYGDNDSGDTVASGVYFLRTQTGGDEVVRMVAVIK
jgi:flagellar hook assembly protein FlgD